MDMVDNSDDESSDLVAGIAAFNLFGARKASIRALWTNSLIVKVVGKIVGKWEPNFKPSIVSVSSIAIWVRFLELPIEYYKPSVLHDLGQVIGPVLRIDTRTTSETRERFTRICVQVESCPYTTRSLERDGEDRTKNADPAVLDCSAPTRLNIQKLGPPNQVESPPFHKYDPSGPIEKVSEHAARHLSEDSALVADRTNQKLHRALSLKGDGLKHLVEEKEAKQGYDFEALLDKLMVFKAGSFGDDISHPRWM
nr:hypothetical protein CFP56_12583 [Quercus suber]